MVILNRRAAVGAHKVCGCPHSLQPLHTAADCNQSHLVPLLTGPREQGGCAGDVNALLAGDTTPVYLAAQVRRGAGGAATLQQFPASPHSAPAL